jgi:hypothetical protein
MSQLSYHYTDASTALKILTSHELWLTHTDYLNDATEGLDIFIYLKKYLKNQDIMKVLTYIDSKTDAYTCSFSTEKDLLSQWRGYCPPEEGYSIGFKLPEKFVNIDGNEDIFIRGMPTEDNTYFVLPNTGIFFQCIYEVKQKEIIIENMALRMDEKYEQLKSDVPDLLDRLNDFSTNSSDVLSRLKDDVWLKEYIHYKYLFKNDAFKEENEYRFFMIVNAGVRQNPCYTTKNGAFVPYYRYCLGDKDVAEVVIRRTKTTKKCKQGLEHFLINHKKMSPDKIKNYITVSDIPFQ